jgi:AcrR family transcriptional regulator
MARRTVKGLIASNKRDAIVAGALRLFGRKGIDATSMRDVAGEVGITDATLYHYFAGKQELAEAACRSISFDVEEMRAIIAANAGDLRATLIAVGQGFIDALAAHSAWTRMILRESLATDGVIAPIAAKAVGELGRRRGALLAECMGAGGRADSERARLAAAQFFHACFGFWIAEALIRHATPPRERVRAYLALLTDATLAALGAPAQAAARR